MLDGAKTKPLYGGAVLLSSRRVRAGKSSQQGQPDEVGFNLPRDPAYDPPKPRAIKWDLFIKNISGDVVAFVNNLRASGHTIEQTWAVGRQIVSRCQYLGLQDAPQKQKPPVQASGPWAGCVFKTSDTEILQSLTQSKWDKAKD
jgi:hypothetical protein